MGVFEKWLCKIGKVDSYAKIIDKKKKVYIDWFECSKRHSLSRNSYDACLLCENQVARVNIVH